MPYVNYPNTSPYATTDQTSWRIGRYQHRAIPPDSGDRPFTLQAKHQYRPDLLSYELYGTPAYYWVFAIRNPFLRRDPIWEFKAGLTIMVPSADYLRRVLGG